LPDNVNASSAARNHFRSFAEQHRLDGATDALILIVSELVSNAVLHGDPPIEVVFRCDPRHATIEVSDGSSAALSMREPDHGGSGGRGLRIVDALADDWGTATSTTGKSVWATIQTAP
jgi:anti-sigma regulatory factor (Ser/Thr protein kinase)